MTTVSAPSTGVADSIDNPVTCLLCGGDSRAVAYFPAEGGNTFGLVTCAGCGVVYTMPRLRDEELANYYQSGYWQESPATQDVRGMLARLQQMLIERRIAWGLRPLIARLPPRARVLDIGCGAGDVLRQLMRAGCQASGVEPSSAAIAQARRTGAPVFHGTLADARHPDQSFDGVTLIHVLEHLGDPVASLREARRILKPGGLLLIEVPNIESFGFAVFRGRWQPLDIPRHLYHFSPRTLTSVVRRCGFDVIHVGHFSARASAAAWVSSAFPRLRPTRFRAREALGESAWPQKIVYLVLQIAALPFAVASAAARRGDVVSIVARKPVTAG